MVWLLWCGLGGCFCGFRFGVDLLITSFRGFGWCSLVSCCLGCWLWLGVMGWLLLWFSGDSNFLGFSFLGGLV